MRSLLLLVVFFSSANGAVGSQGDPQEEIDALLTAVGDSGCTFIRNGKFYGAEKAESHLRMNYKRGRRHATTAEDFIRRLASRSSVSGKDYLIQCDGAGTVTSESWFTERLRLQRNPDSP